MKKSYVIGVDVSKLTLDAHCYGKSEFMLVANTTKGYKTLLKWIKKLNVGKPSLANVVICGQSVINDINFLRFAYRNEKMKWGFSNKQLDLHTVSYLFFQILEKNGKQVPRSLSLGSVASYFGFEREEETHNALEDARLTAKCFKEFFKLIDRVKLI